MNKPGKEGKMRREYMTPRQKLDAGKLIDEHCRLIGEYAVYDDDWSDTRVAELVNVRPDFIHNYRRSIVGNLRPPPAELKTAMLEKIAAQQASLEALMQWAAERPVNPFRRPGQGTLDLKIVRS
jgi:hypothetical protein